MRWRAGEWVRKTGVPQVRGAPAPVGTPLASTTPYTLILAFSVALSSRSLALLHLGSLPWLLLALHTHCGPSSQDTTIPAHTS